MAEHEREADRVKQNSAQARVHNAFHQDVYSLARTAEDGLEHLENYLKYEHQERCDQGPRRVDRIDDVVALEYWRTALREAAETHQIGTQQDGAQQEQRHAHELAHEQHRSITSPLRVGQPLAQPRYFTE